ncbi:MAG TPA: FtsQ-type POTRA domain-containing protein [Chromatiales bacterium]|nr:FtsQ-type POTRA domain-containing protein [Chromatiales bacterium]
MLLLVLMLALGYAVYRWVPAAHEPVRHIDIRVPGTHVTPAEVRAAIGPLARAPFFAVDLHGIERRVRALPWVYRVSVRRLWPDTVRVEVTEQRAVAQWGEDALLNPHGELFRPPRKSFPAGLPRIDGSLARKQALIEAFLDMDRMVQAGSGGHHAARLVEDRRGAWRLWLDNGLEIALGRRAQQRRLQRVMRVYRRILAGREAEVRHLDARYSNGLAIAWQGGGNNDAQGDR